MVWMELLILELLGSMNKLCCQVHPYCWCIKCNWTLCYYCRRSIPLAANELVDTHNKTVKDKACILEHINSIDFDFDQPDD